MIQRKAIKADLKGEKTYRQEIVEKAEPSKVDQLVKVIYYRTRSLNLTFDRAH